MHRRNFIAFIAGASALRVSPLFAAAPLPTMRIVKSPSCGCCAKWVDHVKAAGFPVVIEQKEEFTALKRESGVTAELQSCHTAFVDGYVVEGHVPADVVKKLLTEKPRGVKGLAVPGMPMGSPGMEGGRKDAFTVYSFDSRSHASPYAQR